MKIVSIGIKNIKGISTLKLDLELLPNKVNIFVAPNGFGKTSFGTAFKYLSNPRLELQEKHLHNNDISNEPEVRIEVSEGSGSNELLADKTKNEIRDAFDIFVINSQLKAAGTVQHYGGRTISKFSLDIEPTVLFEKIPQKAYFDYKLSKLKKSFGSNSKVLSNVESVIHEPRLLRKILSQVDLNELSLVRTVKPMNVFIDEINSVKGTEQVVLQFIGDRVTDFLKANTELEKLTKIVQELAIPENDSESKAFLISWQLTVMLNSMTRTQVEKIFKYHDYLAFTHFAKRFISDFNTTRFRIEPVVEKDRLLINWPKAHEISNGQRDILNFVALLLKARLNFSKRNRLLIIDEVFDYLDDANLVSFQYFLTDLIDKANARELNLFPILLTHLDPNFFNHFCFSDGRLRVWYIKEYNVDKSINLHNIIYKREEPTIKAELDEYYFHFNPSQIDIQEKFEALGLVKEWGDSRKFLRKIYREVNNYLDGNTYDPLAICFALRKVIEMKVYNLISNDNLKQVFLKVHGTKNKLLYAQSIGVSIPETYFLLGIIYNTSLHLYNGQNITNSLAYKMENLTIKRLINETCRSH
jgi:hypothetical protein